MDGSQVCVVVVPNASLDEVVALLDEGGYRPSVAGRPSRLAPNGAPALTSRQVEVLQALHRQGGIKAAARELGISARTAENELRAVYRRLGVDGMRPALCWACRRGLLADP